MGASALWSDVPPQKALSVMASLAKRLRAWFSLGPERRARTRKVVRDGLTRGGFFLVGLLLAWLWMMLIGRSMTNRCWLPGVLLQWRHRDGSHKVIDVRLSGRYNGSSLIPFNASLEEARRKHVSKLASENGQVLQRKRRALLQRHGVTGNQAAESGGELKKHVRRDSENELGRGLRVIDAWATGQAKRGLQKSRDEDSVAGEVSESSRMEKAALSGTGQNGGLGVGRRQGTGTSALAARSFIDGAGLAHARLKVTQDSQVVGTVSKRLDGHLSTAQRKPAGKLRTAEEGSDWIERSDDLTASEGGAVRLLQAAGERKNGERSRGVSDVVTLGKDGNALTVVTRPHPRTRLRNLVFGIAATAATWSERKEILRLWWDARRLRGYVWMDTPDLTRDNCSKTATTVRDPLAKVSVLWEAHLTEAIRALNNRTCGAGKKVDYSWMDAPDPELPPVVYSANFSQYAYTHPTGLRSAIRVARVAVEMYRHDHRGDVLWYVMGDDDTIFSPPNLAAVLSKYDPRELVYIGAPSESHLQNVEFSNEMGYGGGGFAVSAALAARLSDIQDECLHRYPEVYGSDARVQACLAELGVHMRKERGFHQYDLLGNIAGALEGHPVTPFLSMHHVAVFQPVFPQRSAMAALAQLTATMKRHPREFLQQTMCLNQAEKFSISIAWGYSVRWYPDFIRPTDLERPQRTFRAWNRGREPFDFDMDTRNTPVTTCRVPSLFHASGATSRLEDGRLLLETTYTRTVTDWTEQSANEDGRVKGGKIRTVSKACSEGEVHIPQREVTEIRILAPPLTDGWVLAPRRQCCQSIEIVDERTAEIRIDACKEGQSIS